ncbi:MAG: type VI secretion system tube protein Hcp [Cellvibrionaceae bacterium]
MYHPTIKGETSDKNHKDWIDILKVKFGTSRNITSSTSTQGDRESSNASMSSLKIVVNGQGNPFYLHRKLLWHR